MATQQQYKTGDLVELKSGGPVMTVQSLQSNGNYYCVWFAGKKLDSGYFHPAALKPAVLKPAVPVPGSTSDDK